MFEIAAPLLAELHAGRPVTVVTAVGVDGSAPRALGSSMALTDSGAVIGSISGGCVEGDAVELARLVAASTVPRRESFGFDDESAFRAGLSCGGRLTVLAWRLAPDDAAAVEALRDAAAGRSASYTIVVDGSPELLGTRVAPPHPLPAHTARVPLGESATALVFVQAPPPRMIIIGAVDFSAALAVVAAGVGYRVSVVDPRALFATPERFPAADEVAVAWPDDYLSGTEVDDRTVIAVLTHSDRFDLPALRIALALPVAYVGAMGSRRTHERRLGMLREAGIPESALERLRSPIGLDLGAATPEETAISIMAEVLAARTGASARPLRDLEGPIHSR
jgi:xanthine dehydrogenase accessory factor